GDFARRASIALGHDTIPKCPSAAGLLLDDFGFEDLAHTPRGIRAGVPQQVECALGSEKGRGIDHAGTAIMSAPASVATTASGRTPRTRRRARGALRAIPARRFARSRGRGFDRRAGWSKGGGRRRWSSSHGSGWRTPAA